MNFYKRVTEFRKGLFSTDVEGRKNNSLFWLVNGKVIEYSFFSFMSYSPLTLNHLHGVKGLLEVFVRHEPPVILLN